MNNGNWTIEQTKRLFSLCDKAKKSGKSLGEAFSVCAAESGRSVNSVRNYYYAQTKIFSLVPDVAKKLGITLCEVKREAFVPFSGDEVKALVEHILVKKGEGVSVRAAIAEISPDDKTALRYQNKYRSYLRSHRSEVEAIMAELSSRGVKYFDPYKKSGADNFERLTRYLAALDQKSVGKFLSIIEKIT
ncbi:MAG: hypothetical protein J1F33_02035 [Clostridiales bacterium]|nr:hypothetical protein [Clostridiales bacterium]